MRSFIVLFSLLLFGTSCTNEKDPSIEFATQLCSCMKPLVDLNKKIEPLIRAQKNEELQALFGEVERLAKEGDSCVERLEMQFGVLEGEQEVKAKKAMRKVCPEVAELLEEADKREQK